MRPADVRRNLSLRPERVRWDAARFGLTPRKLARRFSRGGPAPVIIFSVPKAGTHLAERLLCLRRDYWRPLIPTMDDLGTAELERCPRRSRPGAVLLSHAAHSPDAERRLRRAGFRIACIVRDPRDVAVSAAHYRATDAHRFADAYAGLPLHQRIALSITGSSEIPMPGLRERIETQLGWLEAADVRLRFEQLAGDEPARRAAVAEAFDALGAPRDPREDARISSALVSSASPTFRVGSSGGWSGHADSELDGLIERELAGLLGPYGYGGPRE